MSERRIIEVNDLKVGFDIKGNFYNAVDGVSFTIDRGEVMGIVGESGCGKSVLSMSLMKLLPEKISRISGGEIIYKGENIEGKSEQEINKFRGKEISMIFQEPMTSLNPVFTIGNQLIEMIQLHLKLDKQQARERAIELLRQVGIPRAEKIVDEYPHQLSGGMRQRVMIALAISCMPSLLIADEPTTALDVTVQAQILELLKDVQTKTEMSIIFISHDLGVISEVCDTVAVMYAGRIIEKAKVSEVFKNPKHPYTQLLLKSIPKLDEEVERLETIKGIVPSITELRTDGCRFAERCPFAMDHCYTTTPKASEFEDGHVAYCHLYNDVKEEVVK
ncbi:ABC transporter ATP-binding protein [Macrococcus armenti]|uniref:ABC transporter ATP-binding protein n=1 Tax=Macrococcus armenti TaxID=2875764 RepID=A0ABY3ZW64_9STAP|nr:ABC transporter ATP-binding protein [Macrococcus armenti]UOB21152.1 ABC transporter ATP-binding protein [Macrococcus armenti]